MTAPRLSRADLVAIRAVQAVMLAPFRFATADDWRREIAQSLKPLLGADKVTVIVPVNGRYSAFSDETSEHERNAFPTLSLPLDQRWSMWERLTALGMWSGRRVWGPWYAEYLRTSYHNDFLVPGRFHDSIGLACNVGPGPQRPNADSTAGIWLHHDSPRGPRFGARGAEILRQLLPAWTAGAALWTQLARHRAALAALIDGIGLPIVLFSEFGVSAHHTPALCQLLAEEPDALPLMAELAQMAGALAHGRRDAWEPDAAQRVIRTRRASYRARASLADAELLGPGPMVLVAVERAGPDAPSAEALVERYGLTRSQAEIAVDLVHGLGYTAIADRRGCSVHTVRRHAEQVRAKVGAHSIGEVVARLHAPFGPPRPLEAFDRSAPSR